MLDAFAVIALIAAGFGIINTLLMSVQERTREIGLMKAMGLGGGRIFAMFSIEAIFIGFLGSAIGAAIGDHHHLVAERQPMEAHLDPGFLVARAEQRRKSGHPNRPLARPEAHEDVTPPAAGALTHLYAGQNAAASRAAQKAAESARARVRGRCGVTWRT